MILPKLQTARLGIYRAVLFVWLLFFFCGLSFAQVDGSGATPGVNRPAIAWLKPDAEWQRAVDAMSDNGVKSLRMMLVTPYENSFKVIAYCNQKGIDVLLMVPLTLDAYYALPVSRRLGNKSLYTVPHLSALDISSFESRWGEVVKTLSLRNLRVKAVQIDNEFNSAAFNGDLPLVKGGAILTDQTYQEFSFWKDYQAGMRKLTQVLRIVSNSLRGSEYFKDVPIVLGGLARPTTAWIRNVDGSLVEPGLALRELIALGADRYVDFYAIHLYPQVPRDQWAEPAAAIREYLDERMTEVVAAGGATKVWWITEWGFARRNEDPIKCTSRDLRLPLFKAFQEVIAKSRWTQLVGPTFIYDWDESVRFRIFDGSRVLCTKDYFS